MPSLGGSGSSLGGAFRNALAGVTEHARTSYDAKGWQAQFKELYPTERGFKALGDVLDIKQQRTIENWLDPNWGGTPTAENQAKIHEAYALMRDGGIPRWVKTGKMKISGKVTYGNDTRERGSGGSAALLVQLKNGNWAPVEAALTGDDDDDGHLTHLIATDLVGKDIGGKADYGWSFPGGSYSVTVSS